MSKGKGLVNVSLLVGQRNIFLKNIKIGMDGTFMGRPVSEFTQCKTDLDCKNASRACSIGCGNKIELPFDQLN